jgi:hypothetical protein
MVAFPHGYEYSHEYTSVLEGAATAWGIALCKMPMVESFQPKREHKGKTIA